VVKNKYDAVTPAKSQDNWNGQQQSVSNKQWAGHQAGWQWQITGRKRTLFLGRVPPVGVQIHQSLMTYMPEAHKQNTPKAQPSRSISGRSVNLCASASAQK